MSYIDLLKSVLGFLFIVFLVAYLLLAFESWQFNPALFDPESRRGATAIIALLFFFFILSISVVNSKD